MTASFAQQMHSGCDHASGYCQHKSFCVECEQPIIQAADGAWEDPKGACGCGDGEHEPR